MRILAIIFSLVLSPVASAASLPALRAELSNATVRTQGMRDQRQQLERSLDQVARRIEALKSERAARGALFNDPELDELLKQSQELSSRLSATLASERAAEEWLAAHESKLAGELDREIEALRSRWDRAAGHQERRDLVPRLRGLRAEREALRRAPPATALRAVPESLSDDPEELLERADALLDGEDKLRREERALRARIDQLRRERELERRMDEFLGEGALFDEHDRRISVSRQATALAASREEGASRDPATPPVPGTDGTAPSTPATDSAPNDGLYGGAPSAVGSEGTDMTVQDPVVPGRQGGLDPLVDTSPRSGISRTPPERQGALGAWSDDESLEELEARQTQIRARADELHRKAEDASRQARDLL